MKKWGKRVSIVLVLCVLLSGTLTDVAVFAPDVVQAANAIGLDEEGWLGLQDSYVLKIKKTKQKVSWSSSNTKIVKVTQNGKITGVGYGEAVVTAKVGTKKYQCKVNVYAPTIFDEKNNLIEDKLLMTAGDTKTIRVDWAKCKGFSSNNPKVVSITSKGKMTAKKSGVATISIKDTLKRDISLKVIVQKKGTKKIAPTAIQKKRMTNPEYISYDELVKNNQYDKKIITDAMVKKSSLKAIDNKKLPYFSGIILEERALVRNMRFYYTMEDVYSGGMTSDYITEEEINFQAQNGFNCIRIMYSLSYLSKGKDTSQVNLTELEVLDEIVSWCIQNNVSLMFSFSEAPGYTTDSTKSINSDDSWMSNEKTKNAMKNYMALLAQRYAKLPNSAVMYELEAEPAVSINADGSANLAAYCETNIAFADAIWEQKKDAVCIVEDVFQIIFPEACAAHGINIASHADGDPETVGNFYIVGINTMTGTKYDPVMPCYLPSLISEKSGPMTFVSKKGFAKQKIYIGAEEGMLDIEGKPFAKVYADGVQLTTKKYSEKCITATVPKGTKKITITQENLENAFRVDVVRIGDLVIPTINHYWMREDQGSVLKQPTITVNEDGTYKDDMYTDPSEWYYDVWLKDYDELCKKYGVTFIRTEIGQQVSSYKRATSIGVDDVGNDEEIDNEKAYDLASNKDNFTLALNILDFKLKACKKHNIGWCSMSTNDTFHTAKQLAMGSVSKTTGARCKDTDMRQWKKTGFWYIEPLIKTLKKYR